MTSVGAEFTWQWWFNVYLEEKIVDDPNRKAYCSFEILSLWRTLIVWMVIRNMEGKKRSCPLVGRLYAECITILTVGLVSLTSDSCLSFLTPHSKRGPGSWFRLGPFTMNRVWLCHCRLAPHSRICCPLVVNHFKDSSLYPSVQLI